MNAAAWLTASTAIAIAVVVWFQWMKRNINHVAFGDQIARLCHANNPDRAIKLSGAAPSSPMAVAVKKCLEALDKGAADEPVSETIARLREIYTSSLRADLANGMRSFWLGTLVLADVALGVYFVVDADIYPAPLALDVFAVLILANAWVIARRIAVDGTAQGERLFPIMAATRRPG